MGKRKTYLLRGVGNVILNLALAVIAGLLLAWSLPPKNNTYIAWVVLAPLLIAAARVKWPAAIMLGIFTAATSMTVLGWPWSNAREFGNLSAAFGVLGVVIGTTAAGFSFAQRKFNVPMMAVFTACAGVGLEYMSQWIFPVNIAIVHHRNIQILQIASVTGIWGLSFLVWFTSASAAVAVLKPRSAHLLAAVAVLVMILYASGIDRAITLPPNRTVKVSAVQEKTLFDLAQSTSEAAIQGAKAVCWPELALDDLTQGVSQVSRDLDILLVTGFTESRNGGRPYNSAAVIDRGEYLGSARKTHLIGKEHGIFRKGSGLRIFAPTGMPKIGAAICFDTSFPDVIRALARQGAKVIFVPNWDPLVPTGAMHYLHSAIIPIRAAENAVVIVRSDANGLSQIVHPTGWIISEIPFEKNGQISAEVPLGSGPTIYTSAGDWFVWLAVTVVIISIANIYGRKPQHS